MSNGKNQPLKKVKHGRISVSIWRRIAQKEGADVDIVRACVQHSVPNRDTREWQNQQIWLNVEELRDLSIALDKLNEEGDDSPSSYRVHCIIEYIRANSLDAGLDVYDLDELDTGVVLACFEIHEQLKPFEEMLFISDLRSLIEKHEYAEMSYLATQQLLLGISCQDATDRCHSSPSSSNL